MNPLKDILTMDNTPQERLIHNILISLHSEENNFNQFPSDYTKEEFDNLENNINIIDFNVFGKPETKLTVNELIYKHRIVDIAHILMDSLFMSLDTFKIPQITASTQIMFKLTFLIKTNLYKNIVWLICTCALEWLPRLFHDLDQTKKIITGYLTTGCLQFENYESLTDLTSPESSPESLPPFESLSSLDSLPESLSGYSSSYGELNSD